MIIELVWDELEPISGFVAFYFANGSKKEVDINAPGRITIPSLGKQIPQSARLHFYGPVWNGIVTKLSGPLMHICSPVDDGHNWWRNLVGGKNNDPAAGRGMTIGILDTPIKAIGSLAHISSHDLDGRPSKAMPHYRISHGQIVAEILGARQYQGRSAGISPGARIHAIDISLKDDPSHIEWDRFAPGIEILSAEHHCDLINISGGTAQPDDPDLYRDGTEQLIPAIQRAFDRGTLVLAAVGNEGLDKCALPACLHNVVGVGSIGQCGIGPAGSVFKHYEEQRRAEALIGSTGTTDVFPIPDTASGPGLNVVAPGAGIFVADSDGQFQEFEGTSFACPIVVGILSNALATDKLYRAKSGRQRSQHALGVLHELCVDLQLPTKYQGWGLPILHHQPI